MSVKANSPDAPVIRQLIQAALLGAAFTVLASQELRFEGFETEKVGLLGILATVLVGAAALERLRGAPRERVEWTKVGRAPLTIASGALLLMTAISAAFSLSPARSLWGSPRRAQGLWALALYLILFWGAARESRNLRRALVPGLLMAAVPLCLFALASHFGLDPALTPIERPGSLTGNATFLSSWLVMAMLFCGPLLAWRVAHAPNGRRLGAIAFYASVLALCLVTLVLAGGRAAMLGLMGGLAVLAVTLATLTGRRKLLVGMAGLAALFLVALPLFTRTVLASGGEGVGFLRLYLVSDDSRLSLWHGTVRLLSQLPEPFLAADGSPDAWVGLRPFIGYGPESTELLQLRFDPRHIFELRRSGEVVSIDRFHNLMFDTLATTGGAGLAAWLAIYEAAAYLGLRRLGLIGEGQWWRWLAFQAAGVPVGVGFAASVVANSRLLWVIPVGVALGAFLGTLAWTGSRALVAPTPRDNRLDERTVFVVAILSVVAAQWLDNQFGFVQATTQPLWWLLMGALVGLSDEPQDEPTRLAFEGRDWQYAALVCGLFVIHGLGLNIQSEVLRQINGSPRLVLGLLVAILLAGLAGAGVTASRRGAGLRGWGWVALAWGVSFGLKRVTRLVVAGRLDAVFLAEGAIGEVGASAPLLALSGVGLIGIALAGYVLLWREDRQRGLGWPERLTLAAFFAAGSLVYASRFTAASLHALGNSFGGVEHPVAFALANDLFDKATGYTPNNSKLRVDWMYGLMSGSFEAQEPAVYRDSRARVEEQMAEIQRREPFFTNTIEWNTVMDTYVVYAEREPG